MVDRPDQYKQYPDDCEFHKLIRDKVPEKLRIAGLTAEIVVIENDKDYRFHLGSKLMEEALEVFGAMDSVDDLIGELADVMEVVSAIADHHGIDMQEVHGYREAKREDKGGFQGRIFLLRTKSSDE